MRYEDIIFDQDPVNTCPYCLGRGSRFDRDMNRMKNCVDCGGHGVLIRVDDEELQLNEVDRCLDCGHIRLVQELAESTEPGFCNDCVKLFDKEEGNL